MKTQLALITQEEKIAEMENKRQYKKTGSFVYCIAKNSTMSLMAPFAIGCEGMAALMYVGDNWRIAELPSFPRLIIKFLLPASGILPAVIVGPVCVILNLFAIKKAFGDWLPDLPGFVLVEKILRYLYKSSMTFLSSTREMSILAREYNALFLENGIISNPQYAYPIALAIATFFEVGNRATLDVVLPGFKKTQALINQAIHSALVEDVKNAVMPYQNNNTLKEVRSYHGKSRYLLLGDVFSDHWLSILMSGLLRGLDAQKFFSTVNRVVIEAQFNYENNFLKWGGSGLTFFGSSVSGALENMLFNYLSRQVTLKQELLLENTSQSLEKISHQKLVEEVKKENWWAYFWLRFLSISYLGLSSGTTAIMIWNTLMGLYSTEYNPEDDVYVPDSYGYSMMPMAAALFIYNLFAYNRLYPFRPFNKEAKTELQKEKRRREMLGVDGESDHSESDEDKLSSSDYVEPKVRMLGVDCYITEPESLSYSALTIFTDSDSKFSSSGSEDSPQKRRGSKESHTSTNHSQKMHDIDTDSGAGTEEDSLSSTPEKQLNQNPVALEEGPSRSGSDESITSQLLESSAEEKNQSSPEIRSQLSHHWWKKLDVFGLLSSSEKRKNSNSASDDSSTYTPPSETPLSNNNEQQNDVIELQEVRRNRSHRSRHM